MEYMKYGRHKVSRAEFERALSEKRKDADFARDIEALLPVADNNFNHGDAFDLVEKHLISRLHGEPWKRTVKDLK